MQSDRHVHRPTCRRLSPVHWHGKRHFRAVTLAKFNISTQNIFGFAVHRVYDRPYESRLFRRSQTGGIYVFHPFLPFFVVPFSQGFRVCRNRAGFRRNTRERAGTSGGVGEQRLWAIDLADHFRASLQGRRQWCLSHRRPSSRWHGCVLGRHQFRSMQCPKWAWGCHSGFGGL